jgi:hypothetical protein
MSSTTPGSVIAILSSLCAGLEAERASIATLDHARLRALIEEREAQVAALGALVAGGRALSPSSSSSSPSSEEEEQEEREAVRVLAARLRGLLRGQQALYQQAFVALGEALGLVTAPARRTATYDARARLQPLDDRAHSARRGTV